MGGKIYQKRGGFERREKNALVARSLDWMVKCNNDSIRVLQLKRSQCAVAGAN